MKYCLLLSVFLLLSSCDKKTATQVDPENVRDQLAHYGELNPENEVLIETNFGNMRIRLYRETPLHRANFIKNIKEGVYEDAAFYRIVSQFMIQAGIYPKELNYTIPAELNQKLIHKKGAVSMARGDDDNPDRRSSPTEFFIVQGAKYLDYQVDEEAQNYGLTLTAEQKKAYMTAGGYMSLDQEYTTFGEVVEGLDVIDKIAAVKVFNEDKPLKEIAVKVTVVGSR